MVDHLTSAEDGGKEWYRATVIRRWKKGLRCIYDSESATPYDYTREEIEKDLQNRDLKVTELTIGDVIGRHVMHRFQVDDDLVWFKGFVSLATKARRLGIASFCHSQLSPLVLCI